MARHSQARSTRGFAARAASTIQSAWRASRGKRMAKFQPLVRTNRLSGYVQTAINAATGVAGMAAGRSMVSLHSSLLQKGIVVNEGTGGQFSSFKAGAGDYLDPSVKKTLASYKTIINGAGQLLSPVGTQNSVVALTLYDNADMAVMQTDAGYNTGTYPQRTNYYLDSAHGSATLTNIYLSNVTVDIYDVVARKDVSATALSTIQATWATGDVDEALTNGYKKVGSTPFQAEAVNTYWKVLKKTQVVLGAGQMHKHHVQISPHQLVRGSYLYYTQKAYRDLTYNTLFVIHGQPANDTVTQTQVTLGSAGINYIFEKEYKFKIMQGNTESILDHSALLTAFTIAEQVVNVGGSTVTANAEG